jgi:serine phosphatase RsbU (regulator of sigma subunit)
MNSPVRFDLAFVLVALAVTLLVASGLIVLLFRENRRVKNEHKSLWAQLTLSNRKLEIYAERLRDESMRLQAEVNIARKIQTMVLPRAAEMQSVVDLEIAASMMTAAEVGGDYYDVIQVGPTVTLGIGDVTGHGLASGVIMLMAQTVVRTLAELGTLAPEAFLAVVNRVLFANIQRIREDRNMTLMLLTYREGRFVLTGQHENVLILRNTGAFEVLDSLNLGFYVGLLPDIADKVSSLVVSLEPGELMVLYTDGITEAQSPSGLAFGEQGLCEVVLRYQRHPVEKLGSKVLQAVTNHIGDALILDDLSLVLIRQR